MSLSVDDCPSVTLGWPFYSPATFFSSLHLATTRSYVQPSINFLGARSFSRSERYSIAVVCEESAVDSREPFRCLPPTSQIPHDYKVIRDERQRLTVP